MDDLQVVKAVTNFAFIDIAGSDFRSLPCLAKKRSTCLEIRVVTATTTRSDLLTATACRLLLHRSRPACETPACPFSPSTSPTSHLLHWHLGYPQQAIPQGTPTRCNRKQSTNATMTSADGSFTAAMEEKENCSPCTYRISIQVSSFSDRLLLFYKHPC